MFIILLDGFKSKLHLYILNNTNNISDLKS